ncbi:NAD-dependent aldehyde dehydrogenase [Cladophialophora psammophila CBS 110553]|uniref:NAD-dependent aldehyde dehydrogenase n=1 Tax=Cladophialophora psammophila CBS 110553 TaxID=1182543 RepID=W9XFZ2_9EURO|nr:NAD-dependent aldehyde dehydrogenase [Cladophialophora psammophila CBS 110553]EXJ75836.1 NAD-dependent aldehyde dehydrogenase [Cladophialophora psammophila CBS 110553]
MTGVMIDSENGDGVSRGLDKVPLHITGKSIYTDHQFQTINPAMGEVIATVSGASLDEAKLAVTSAEVSFPAWSETEPGKRRTIFLRAADILEQRAFECSKYMRDETGADVSWCKFNVQISAELLRDIAGRIATIQGFIPATSAKDCTALVYKEPWGVILAIAPWNAPYILGFRSVAYALAAGNTCVLKGSEISPRCFWAIVSIFEEAGLPPGCLNVIYHRPKDAAEVTRALIEHPAVKKINFTGSTTVGRIIAEIAGKNIKPVLMELGGKASTIILEDADLQQAARACARGSFLHAGQICMSCERIIVQSSVTDAFVEALMFATKERFGQGDGMQLMVSDRAADRTNRLVQQAISGGARPLAGHDTNGIQGARMTPVVLKGVTKEMDLYYTESFGPTVILITVDDEEQAVAVANDTEYGLSAAVFTRDLQKALRLVKKIDSGAVHINGMTVHDEPTLPHGGVKNSGFGRFGSDLGLEEFLRTKTVTFQN